MELLNLPSASRVQKRHGHTTWLLASNLPRPAAVPLHSAPDFCIPIVRQPTCICFDADIGPSRTGRAGGRIAAHALAVATAAT